jgi:hypothetical protein
MLRKDRIAPAADGHPQAGELLGTIGEYQAKADVINELQRGPLTMDAQAWQSTKTPITLFLQVFNTIPHGFTLSSALELCDCSRIVTSCLPFYGIRRPR